MPTNNVRLSLIVLCAVAITNWTVRAQNSNIAQQVEELLGKMTLEEKIGQMNQYNGFWNVTGPAPKEGNAKEKYEDLKSGRVGSVLNVRGAEEVRKMQELVVNQSRLGIPLIFAQDVIHGYKTLAPIPLAEAASWDMQAIEQSARMAAIEGTAHGLNWTFAPMVDIARDARWGRVMEGAGEDPYLGARIAAARVKGFQGDDLSANNTMAACAKHFIGYGWSESGRDYNTVDFGPSTMYNVLLPPFRAAIESDVKTFMNSFNIVDGIPATANEFLQRDLLKGKMGFDGFIVSDWGSIREIAIHGAAANLEEAAVLAARAGSDMDMESMAYVKYLKSAVEDGRVKEAHIDDAVRRILKVKFELGLFDDPYKYCDPEREKELLYNPAHQEIALDMAKRSIVLLKNEGELLPLKKGQKIAVIGELAADKTSPLGSWRIASDDGTAVSVVEGLKAKGVEFTYQRGPAVFTSEPNFVFEMEVNETDYSGMDKAVALAKDSEVVIMVLGEHGFQSGEARSRVNLDLPGLQQELLEAVYKVNKNIVLILMNGRPLALPWAAENIPSIVEGWQLGSQTGNALAEVLLGMYNPSGKLPMSFPRSVGQVPIYYNHFNTGRPQGNDNTVFWTHYIDGSNSPLFPFGFGLSYTRFDYSNFTIESNNDRQVTVSGTVQNIGEVKGEEVVQLYLRDKAASVVRPVKELKGFQKIELAPGESRVVRFTLTDKELGFYLNDGTFVVEPGEFDVMIGPNSEEGLKGSFVLK